MMKIGKLPNSLLNSLIIEPVNKYGVNRSEVLVKPSIGEDCTALDLKGEVCILSTDPITGAASDIGKIAVNINANDIAAGGGEPVGLLVTALLPPDITEEEIRKINEDLYSEAAKINVAILGGHTEITDAVNRPVLSCTVVGKGKRLISSGGAKVGDELVVTKYAALEGSAIFAADKRERLADFLSDEELDEARGFTNLLSVVKEGEIAARLGANALHDVTEGGILGACWEIANCSGYGVEVNADAVPVHPVTKKICTCLGVDPLRLISSGSMLIAIKDGNGLCSELEKVGIKATVIGKITPKDFICYRNGKAEVLCEPDTDELYKI